MEFKESFLEVLGKNMVFEERGLKVKLVDGWKELLGEQMEVLVSDVTFK